MIMFQTTGSRTPSSVAYFITGWTGLIDTWAESQVPALPVNIDFMYLSSLTTCQVDLPRGRSRPAQLGRLLACKQATEKQSHGQENRCVTKLIKFAFSTCL
jgi:hypothetical protein